MNQLRNLLQEIHRRSLWQLLGSYGVGAWIVLQLADVLTSLIGLPLWFGHAVLVLLGIGLGLILLTALIQGGIRSRPASPTASRRSWPGRTFTWRNAAVGAAVVGGLLVVGTGGYMGLRAAGIGPAGTLVARGVLDDADRIILAELENRTMDSDLAGTVTALLRIDLSQSPTITLLEPVQLEPVLRRMQKEPGDPVTFDVAREIAQREGLKAVVAGEVLPLGAGFVISARLVASGTGESLATAKATASDIDHIPNAVDALSASLRERIGDSLRMIQAEPALAQVTTASIEALRDYARAEQRNEAGDPEGALTLLQAAIDRDSTFAMAYRKLAVILDNMGREPGRARVAARRAYELRDRLGERERDLAEAAWHMSVNADNAAAIASYERMLVKYPNDPVALNNLASLYIVERRDEDADRLLRRAIAQGGAPTVAWMNLVTVEFALGRIDSARAAQRAFTNDLPDSPVPGFFGARISSATFDHQAAATEIRSLIARFSERFTVPGGAMQELGDVLVAQGRLEEALAEYRKAFMVGRPGDAAERSRQWDVVEAMLRAYADFEFLGDTRSALRRLDALPPARLSIIVPEQQAYFIRVAIYAGAGRPDQASRVLADYEASVPAPNRATPPARSSEAIARGQIAEARGQADEASRLYREAETVSECRICGIAELAGLYDRTGQTDSAIASYERYLATPDLNRISRDNVRLWRVLWRLGSLYEAAGDTRRATENYTRFLVLWADADPPLQPRLREVRERLARLAGPG